MRQRERKTENKTIRILDDVMQVHHSQSNRDPWSSEQELHRPWTHPFRNLWKPQLQLPSSHSFTIVLIFAEDKFLCFAPYSKLLLSRCDGKGYCPRHWSHSLLTWDCFLLAFLNYSQNCKANLYLAPSITKMSRMWLAVVTSQSARGEGGCYK